MAYLALEQYEKNSFHVLPVVGHIFRRFTFHRKQLRDFLERDILQYSLKTKLEIDISNILVVIYFENRRLDNHIRIYYLYKKPPLQYPIIYYVRYLNDFSLKYFIKTLFYKDTFLGYESNISKQQNEYLKLIDVWHEDYVSG